MGIGIDIWTLFFFYGNLIDKVDRVIGGNGWRIRMEKERFFEGEEIFVSRVLGLVVGGEILFVGLGGVRGGVMVF